MASNKPNIVVLDGYTLNPGDLSWEGLRELGEYTVYDRTSPEQTVKRAQHAEIILTNKTILDSVIIDALPEIQYIGVMATGYNVVDMDAADERHITITNVPAYSTMSVVQMVFAHLLEFTQQVGYHSGTVRSGRWESSVDFCYWDKPLFELNGRTMGIIGYGRIGRNVARVARAFGMNVLVYDVTAFEPEEPGIKSAELDELFSQSDVISLHCPLTEETREIINAGNLSRMKKSAILINTGRGPLVNDRDLADALNTGKIAGAGLDVLTVEPPQEGNPLFSAKNCHITPHIAWASFDARNRLMDVVVDNIRAFLNNEPKNVVNSP